MARLVLTVAGAAIGFAIGGPFGAQVGAMIGGMVGNMLFAPTIHGPRLQDLTVTASTYGNCIPELYGTMRLGGNLIWTAGIKEHKKKSSGKGGPKQVTYTYTASFAIAFCKGVVNNFNRIWADGKLIIGSDVTGGKGTFNPNTPGAMFQIIAMMMNGKKKKNYKVRFYAGTEEQLPDPIIEQKEGVGKAPAYRGMCYLVFENMPLEDFGNRIPQLTCEMSRSSFDYVPQIAFTQANGTVLHHQTAAQFAPESDTVVAYDGVDFITFDMATMTERHRVRRKNGWGAPAHTRSYFSCDGKYYTDEAQITGDNGSGSWGGIGVWSTETGEMVAKIAGSAGGSPLWPERLPRLGRSFSFRIPTPTGPTHIFCIEPLVGGPFFMANLATGALIWGGDEGSDSSLGSALMLRGKEEMGIAECNIIEWDIVPGTMRISNFRVPATAMGAHGQNPDGSWWHGNDPFIVKTTHDVSPFPEVHFGAHTAAYDKSDNSVIFWGVSNGEWCFCKYLLDEGEWKWKWRHRDYGPEYRIQNGATPSASCENANLLGGKVAWAAGGGIFQADLSTGRLLGPPKSVTYGGGALMANSYDDSTDSIVGHPTRIYLRGGVGDVTVQTVVNDVLNKTGALNPEDYDTSVLAAHKMTGYSISRDCTARDVLNQLASAFFFDGFESDYKIKIKMRGGASQANWTENQIGRVQGRDVSVQETRQQELELPMRVSITYADVARDYQESSQFYKRLVNPIPSMHSNMEHKFELPMTLTADQAKQMADKSLKMAWSNRVSYRTKLPWAFLKYDPADVVTLTMNSGTAYTMRLGKMNMGVDFSIECEGISELPAAYVSTAKADHGTGIPAQTSEPGGHVELFVLNTPLLRDTDDTMGVSSAYYLAARSMSPAGAKTIFVHESLDGLEYEDLASIANEPVYGFVSEALPPRISYGIDETLKLTVRMMSFDDNLQPDTLESITDEQLFAGKNTILVGKEVIQFRDAKLNDDGTYTISGILRARRGTNYAVRDHKPGERLIVLDQTAIIKLQNGPNEWDAKHSFKAVSAGNYVEDVTPVGLDMDPNDLKPYTPECVTCGDDGINVLIKFERRSRITAELKDGGPEILYREGQGSLARFTYKVFPNKTLADKPWEAETPTFTGNVAIYNGVNFAPLQFTFPKGDINEFVVEIFEVGFVDGFSKYVHFKRIHANDWDMTELY